MSLLAGMKSDPNVQAETNVLGGGYTPLATAAYLATVVSAYVIESAAGAAGVSLEFKTGDNKSIRETVYVSTNKANGQRTYYERDGKKNNLPGFTLINSLGLLTIGTTMDAWVTEKKTVKAWESGKEVMKSVDMAVDLIGQEIYIGLQREVANKTAKNDLTGKYEDTNEKRTFNSIDKFFRAADKLTVADIKAGTADHAFFDLWVDKFTDVDKVTYKQVAGSPSAPAANQANATGAPAEQSTSLFAPKH